MKIRKSMALLLVSMLLVSMMAGMFVAAAAETSFSDVPQGTHEYLSTLKNAGILQGSNGKFNGEDTMSRAAFATLLNNFYQLPSSGAAIPDVSPDSWYAAAVRAVVAANYMSVGTEGNFAPTALVTCEDVFTLVEKCVAADNTLRPDPQAIAPLIKDLTAPVTRYQAAAVVNELYLHRSSTLPLPAKMVVGYYGNWQVYGLLAPGNIPWNKLTHLNHAFLTVSDGTPSDDTFAWEATPKYALSFTDSWADIHMDSGAGTGGTFKVYELMHRIYPGVNITMSVGGWTRGQMFSAMATTPENRKIFIESAVAMMKDNPWIGGIDLDWEYPGVVRDPVTDAIDDPVDFGTGVDNPQATIVDKDNFTALLKELRGAMDAAGLGSKTLTICESVNYAANSVNQDLDEVAKYVNFVNLMTYDYTGAYDETTGHHAALYTNEYNAFSVEDTVTNFLKHFAPEQLNIGVASYSRGWANVVPDANGNLLGQPAGAYVPAADTGHPDASAASRYFRGDGNSGFGKYEAGEEWSEGKHKATDFPEVVGEWFGLYPGACFKLTTLNQMLADTTGRYKAYYDAQAEAPYLYDTKEKLFLSYEDARSTQAKVDYVWANNLGGLIFWEVSTDDIANGFTLTTIQYEGVCK